MSKKWRFVNEMGVIKTGAETMRPFGLTFEEVRRQVKLGRAALRRARLKKHNRDQVYYNALADLEIEINERLDKME